MGLVGIPRTEVLNTKVISLKNLLGEPTHHCVLSSQRTDSKIKEMFWITYSQRPQLGFTWGCKELGFGVGTSCFRCLGRWPKHLRQLPGMFEALAQAVGKTCS